MLPQQIGDRLETPPGNVHFARSIRRILAVAAVPLNEAERIFDCPAACMIPAEPV